MGRVLVSACLIVRNEARFLERCLRSIRPLVDEIVVVDTGSTDHTKRIARGHGSRLYDFPWIDDFAAARNHGLDRARGEWILYIDADERVRRASRSRLRAQLRKPDFVGYFILLHARPGFTPYWEMRLFRNDPRIRFRRIIHENIWPGIDAYRSAEGGQIGRSELVFDHDGYEGDQSAKHRRNLPLLRRALRKDPTGVYSWCHLANIYVALGKGGLAEKAWAAALAVVRGKAHPPGQDSLPYIGLIEWSLHHGRPVEPLLAEALHHFPSNLYLQWLQGTALMRAGAHAEAIGIFERLIRNGERGTYDRALGYDLKLLSTLPREALATCHFELGHYEESRRYFEMVEAGEPDRLEHRLKRALSARLAGLSAAPRLPWASAPSRAATGAGRRARRSTWPLSE
jgi:hypothetical protein